MQLGVNFAHAPRLGIGFDRSAVLGLRPTIVRHVLCDPPNTLTWIRHADTHQLNVLWCLPVECIGVAGARLAARLIATHGLGVTAGLEIGCVPWRHLSPLAFVDQASAVLELLAFAHDPQIPTVRAFTVNRPILLGAGFDGSPAASAWLIGLLRCARAHATAGVVRDFVTRCHGLSCHAVTPGRPFRRRLFAAVRYMVGKRLNLPITFTRIGWQLEERLATWPRIQEWARLAWAGRSDAVQASECLTRSIRRRWILEAYTQAGQLGARHFVLEADQGPDGQNGWGLYDARTSRTDPVWHTLQWRNLPLHAMAMTHPPPRTH